MRDKVLAYALAASVGVHIVILGMVGRTSAARPIDLDELKVVRVEMVKLPDAPIYAEAAKPTPIEREHASIPPPEKIPVAPKQVRKQKLPGNPGGPLDIGTPSAHGENLGPSGRTPVGWVPNPDEGAGIGSGRGEGVGEPEPVPGAVEGSGKEAAPSVNVDVKVCAESGMLPGPNCERTTVKSFRPGSQPDSKCTVCKPKHVSTLADRSVPELISGRKTPKYPESAKDRGIEGSVTVEYTINTEGNIVGVKIASSSGSSDLDKAALDTVESRKYKPAVQAGIPRNYRKRETFHFKLD